MSGREVADFELGDGRRIGICLGGVSRNMIRSLSGLAVNSAGAAMAGAVLLGGAGWVHGHQDPRGDIHPQVSVMDGKFVIVFTNSQPNQESNYTDAIPIQRMIYTADGTLFAPRHPLQRKRSWRETGPVGLYGRAVRLGESTVIFQDDQAGQPGYLLKSPAGHLKRVRLPWPATVSLSLFEDALVVPEGIAITGKEGRDSSENDPLKFYWFSHESTAAPTILTIGVTACIYNFPVASNVAFAGGRFWVAYMRPTEKGGLKLALWSWRPGDHDGLVEILEAPADWNSHLSMAALGERLCLAYHCVNDHQYPGEARIVTVFRKAE
jgi:hypothetical protein